MNILSLFVFQQNIIVDRIEHNFAVVEWENNSFSVIPLDDFTRPPQEGEVYQFQLKRFSLEQCSLRQNDPIVLQCNENTLVIPNTISWKGSHHLSWSLRPLHLPNSNASKL